MSRSAISLRRNDGFSEWYQAVIIEAGLAERSSVRGCMVIKPWGYAIWENMQSVLDRKFKELGVQNCYFPLFVPVSLFEKEAAHVVGFAQEVAVVTHSKLENVNGKFVPTNPIEVPLVVRPTSEMIIGESLSKWVKSHRDLPIKVNQWCNVVRWEMRTRLFLRTMEFLWQEGHTAHETQRDAEICAQEMHDVYRWFIENVLKIPSINGTKPDHERFPGAVETLSVEVMAQDGKALQAATSHYLGQNFAKAVKIQFQNADRELSFAHTTSWGLSTRIIGALVMVHGDDDGINLPTAIAPYHIVIIPMSQESQVVEFCNKIKADISEYRMMVDSSGNTAQNKKWDYVRKGIPIICEIGMRDVAKCTVSFTRRQPIIQKQSCDLNMFAKISKNILKEHDAALLEKALQMNKENTKTGASDFSELSNFFGKKNKNGFVIAKWSENPESVKKLEELGITIRCKPFQQTKTTGKCVLTGVAAVNDFVFARTY
jgi:prolyl-tRNA synthetase